MARASQDEKKFPHEPNARFPKRKVPPKTRWSARNWQLFFVLRMPDEIIAYHNCAYRRTCYHQHRHQHYSDRRWDLFGSTGQVMLSAVPPLIRNSGKGGQRHSVQRSGGSPGSQSQVRASSQRVRPTSPNETSGPLRSDSKAAQWRASARNLADC